MEHNNDIAEILSRRAPAPMARADLSERIIHAAMTSPRAKTVSWSERLMGIFALPIPRMAMVASVLVMMLVAVNQTSVVTVMPSEQVVKTDTDFTAALDVFDDEQLL